MKFLGWRKKENVLEILGMIDVIVKEDKSISQVGPKEELNNTLDSNKLKLDVKLLDIIVEVLLFGKEDGDLDLEIDSLDQEPKKHLS